MLYTEASTSQPNNQPDIMVAISVGGFRLPAYYGPPGTQTLRRPRESGDPEAIVIPAKAGIQWRSYKRRWIPAFAGMTDVGSRE